MPTLEGIFPAPQKSMLRTLMSHQPMLLCAATLLGAVSVGFAIARRESSPRQTTPAEIPVTITFAAQVQDQSFACGRLYQHQGISWTPTDLRFFVSDVRLITSSGQEQPVRLEEDGRWQTQGVAMLDFEDGSGACLNGTSETRTVVTGRVPPGSYRGISFSIGVPFDLNHADPAQMSAPLSLSIMQWSWRAGHKFLRFGAKLASGGHYEIHLGSTHCDGTIGHVSACRRPNRPRVLLNGTFTTRATVVVDVDRLLEGAPVSARDADGSVAGCMSAADDTGCVPVFDNLGLELQTGAPTGVNKVVYVK